MFIIWRLNKFWNMHIKYYADIKKNEAKLCICLYGQRYKTTYLKTIKGYKRARDLQGNWGVYQSSSIKSNNKSWLNS